MASISPVVSLNDETAVAALCANYGVSTSEYRALHDSASAAKSMAYCRYSNYQVGSALLAHDGTIFDGANVENASYPVGTCAERTAMGPAVFRGYGRPDSGDAKQFKAIAVSTNNIIEGGDGVNELKGVASPCGMCRQFIREFSPLQMPIFMFDKDGKCVATRLKDLLPLSFGPDSLI